MSKYFDNCMGNAIHQHLSRVDNLGAENDVRMLIKSTKKHRPRGKAFLIMYELAPKAR
jgi:hypothetical protein